jgi:hypothetical protein
MRYKTVIGDGFALIKYRRAVAGDPKDKACTPSTMSWGSERGLSVALIEPCC